MTSQNWPARLEDNHFLQKVGNQGKPIGLLFSNGENWKQSRKFVHRMLSEFELNKTSVLDTIALDQFQQLEQKLTRRLMEQGGNSEETFSPNHMFEPLTLNITLLHVLFGHTYDHDDPQLQKLLRCMCASNRKFNFDSGLVDHLPWLRHIPGLTYVESVKEFLKVFKSFVQVRSN